MEHRWSVRKKVTGNVIVKCPRVGEIRAALRDMSFGGMFIETRSAALPVHAPVSVIVNARLDGKSLVGCCFEAMVVRSTAEGAGLMFLEIETDMMYALRGFLFGPPIAVHESDVAVVARRSVRSGSRSAEGVRSVR